MTKRRNNLFKLLRGPLLLIILLTIVVSGCKKKPSPEPPKVTPLPPKVQGAAPPVAQTVPVSSKPIHGAISSAQKVAVKKAVQAQISVSKRLAAPAGSVNLDFTRRRDPFKPFAQAPTPQQATIGKSAKGRVRDPLPIQTFDTEKFKVSGIVTGLKESSALIIDPNGKGYVVKEGMPIGSNDGHVKKITNSTVEVEESFRDDNGKVRKRLVKLMLLRKK